MTRIVIGLPGGGATVFPNVTDRVPEFTLETGLAVKEKLPEAEFFVESFMPGRKEGCPFFGITCKGRDYYLEVWNEPGFKAKRLA